MISAHANDGIVSSAAKSTVGVILATLFYAYALRYSHIEYLSVAWEYYGFTYRQPGWIDTILSLVFLVGGALCIPRTLQKPSSIVVVLLYVVVYVPTVVITLALDTNRLANYGASLVTLAVTFAVVCLASRDRATGPAHETRVPNDIFALFVLIAWALCCGILIATYGSVMNFAGLGDIYQQRAAGAATSLFMGYVQTYFSNVLSPALIILGLVRSRIWSVVLGCAGCVIMYMITAQRTIILLPIAVFAVYFALSRKSDFFRTASFLMVFLGVTSIVAVSYQRDSAVASVVALLLVFRTLGLPGLTFSQYHDLFSENGFTLWSHVRGLGALLPAPPAFWSDAQWPGLGYVVGNRVYGDAEHNVVANLFSGDGVAAAGAAGIAVIGVLLAGWLAWFDRLSSGWDRTFAILVTLPLALSLTNGHLFTTLLSFGGFFWMLMFAVYKPYRPNAGPGGL